jgi:CheY-like chemotaxis protein
LRFAVRDTGVGIPREKQALVFEAFTQADNSVTRKYGGAGLGLAISAKLIDLMGGTIRLVSEVGKGTTFEFAVPYQVAENAVENTTLIRGIDVTLPPMHILLAEDNPVNQLVASRMLEKDGHTVRTVSNGREAVATVRRESFDLILMDVQMPELNGFDATAAIRAEEAGTARHVPILAMTANAMVGDRDRCIAAGMDGYVSKPFRKAELMEQIARVIKESGVKA